MKYRIISENNKFRAYIGKPKLGALVWTPIENDNEYFLHKVILYDSIEEAKEACKKHHERKLYFDNNTIIEEFEL